MAIQTEYKQKMDIGREGQIVNTELNNCISRNVEGDEGIGFGKPVTRGEADRSARLTKTGDTKILGISVRERSVDANTVDVIAKGRELRVMTKGVTFVKVSAEVNQGDKVYVDVVTGNFSKSGGIAIANAEFDTSASENSMARVRLS